MRGIYEGQKIDKDLEETETITTETLDKYFLMTKKFTGGHIRYGLEIGQLLAGKVPDKDVSLIAELLGINRQIVDDFEDYFKAHHHPFGDIKRGAKRIPEIFFTLQGGNRMAVLEKIEKKDFAGVIDLVLTKKVRNSLYLHAKENIDSCKNVKTNFDYSKIFVDIDQLLSREV